MKIRLDIPADPKMLEALLFGLCVVNAEMLRRMPYPTLYTSGVVYKREPPRREDWWTIAEIYEKGWGDCEDLACWRVAELRVNGEEARPLVIEGGRNKLHTVVLRADGTVEDPSKMLGMKGRA